MIPFARRLRPASAALLVAVAALALAACSLVSDAQVAQCATTADCTGRGASFANAVCVDSWCVAKTPVEELSAADAGLEAEASSDADAALDPWRCVGHVTYPIATNAAIVDHASFVNPVDNRGIAGLNVEVCERSDVGCAKPLASAVTDENGKLDIPLYDGFSGYLQMRTAPSSMPGLMPTLFSYLPPARAGRATLVPTVTLANVMAVGQLIHQQVDLDHGALFIVATSCDGIAMPGVELEIAPAQTDAKTARYYFSGGLPAPEAKATNSTGLTGFVNVPPNSVSITAKLAATGQTLGVHTVVVRPGTLTGFYFPPTPL